jgi:hypothetical protein
VENDPDGGRAARWSKEVNSSKSKVMDAITRRPQSSNSAGPVQEPSFSFRTPSSAVLPPLTEDRGDENVSREAAFRDENNDRKYQAGNRRAGLMGKAETVFRKLKTELGRNPGSTALRAALSVAGHAISDRDSRWLAKQLPLSYAGEAKSFLAAGTDSLSSNRRQLAPQQVCRAPRQA